MTLTTKGNLGNVLHDWFMKTNFSTDEGKQKIMCTLEKDIQFMLRVYDA